MRRPGQVYPVHEAVFQIVSQIRQHHADGYGHPVDLDIEDGKLEGVVKSRDVECAKEQDWFEHERKAIFERSWTFAGTTHDFQETGDYRIVSCGHAQIIVVMDKSAELRAMHNVCRHRGAELLDGPSGNCGGTMVCPYHRWTYGLDGALRGVPNMAECFPDLDRSKLGLNPAALGVFNDFVFVNPDANARA